MKTSNFGCLFLCAMALGCSGSSGERLRTSRDPATDGGVTTGPSEAERPSARALRLGVSGGQSASPSFRARIVLNYPRASATARSASYAAHLTYGAQP